MKMRSLLICLLLSMATTFGYGQMNTPAPSPFAKINQVVGLTEVTVAYSRPAMKGRKIMGELVPFGKLWRTGANRATKISFSEPMSIQGNKLEAGDYALFTIPNEKDWTIVISNKGDQNGSAQYNEAEDAVRFTVKSMRTADSYENFTILFSDIKDNAAMINIIWENTKVQFSIEDFDVDEKVMAQIMEMMPKAGDDDNVYFAAASYYYENDKDMQQAAEWVDKAVEINNEKYWVMHLQAKVYAKLNDMEKAKNAAEQSKALAQKAGNADYVKLNEKLINSMR